jgi:hypothetical protein
MLRIGQHSTNNRFAYLLMLDVSRAVTRVVSGHDEPYLPSNACTRLHALNCVDKGHVFPTHHPASIAGLPVLGCQQAYMGHAGSRAP